MTRVPSGRRWFPGLLPVNAPCVHGPLNSRIVGQQKAGREPSLGTSVRNERPVTHNSSERDFSPLPCLRNFPYDKSRVKPWLLRSQERLRSRSAACRGVAVTVAVRCSTSATFQAFASDPLCAQDFCKLFARCDLSGFDLLTMDDS